MLGSAISFVFIAYLMYQLVRQIFSILVDITHYLVISQVTRFNDFAVLAKITHCLVSHIPLA